VNPSKSPRDWKVYTITDPVAASSLFGVLGDFFEPVPEGTAVAKPEQVHPPEADYGEAGGVLAADSSKEDSPDSPLPWALAPAAASAGLPFHALGTPRLRARSRVHLGGAGVSPA
jgi:hypothetical protein